MANNNIISGQIDNFLSRLTLNKHLAPQTVANYRLYLKKFLQWINQEKINLNKINDITTKHLTDYQQWLKNQIPASGHTLSLVTQNYYLIALRSFLKNLTSQGLAVPNYHSIKLNRYRQSSGTTVTGDEIKSILRACEESQESELIKRRDRAIVNLLFTTGLKVSEIARLKRTDFKNEQTFLLITSDKKPSRQVPLTNEVKEPLNNYLAARHDTDPALFISHDRAQTSPQRRQHSNHVLSPRSLQRIVARWRRRAGIRKKITPSSLRQFFAQSLIEQGTKIDEVQKTLGHTNKITTRALYKKSKLGLN